MTADLTGLPGVGLVRTDDHRYYWNGEGPFPGVTTVQGVLDKSTPMMLWAAKQVAEAAVRDAYRTAWARQSGIPEADLIKQLAKLPERQRDAAASTGTAVHWHAEQIALGRAQPVDAQEWPFIRQYLAWRDDWQPEYTAVEYMGINLTHRYGGTGDLIIKSRGERWLLDIKTGRYYDETALQLVACSEFEFVGKADDPTPYPMPAVDRFGVLDLKPDGWKVVPYQFDREAAFAAFAHLAALYHWKRTFKKVRRDPFEGHAEEEADHDAA